MLAVQCKVHIVYVIFTKEIDIVGSQFMLRSTLCIPKKKYGAIFDSDQSNNASWMPNEGNSSDKTYYEGQVSESVLTKLASLIL